MKSPATLLNACLVLGVATIASQTTSSGLVAARPMHADIDYPRYLLEKDDIVNELKKWMAKWKDAAQKNGWIPAPKVANASDDDVEEDRKQRFFMAKQLVTKLKTQNPQAEFTTDSPFSLLTTEEFSAYIKNSYIAGGGSARQLRQEMAEAATLTGLANDDGSSHVRSPSAAPTSAITPSAPPLHRQLPFVPIFSSINTPASALSPEASGDSNSLDWSTGKCMPPVQDQGQCGSCWSFAAVAAVEASQCIAQGAGASFTKYSEQTLASCDTRNAGCDGGVPQYALQYIQTNGLCTLADDPYTSSSGTLAECNTKCARHMTDMTGVKPLAQQETILLGALDEHPVIVAVQAGNEAWKQYKSGVLSACPDADAQIDHAVVAVGYDATAIKIRNSWGPRWGEAGYVHLARSTGGLGTCKMLQQMVHATF